MPDSHYICSSRYYLAVSATEEGYEGAVYDLGEVGEIRDIQWLDSKKEGTVRLSLRVLSYPEEYFKRNKELIKSETKYEFHIEVNRLMLKRLN